MSTIRRAGPARRHVSWPTVSRVRSGGLLTWTLPAGEMERVPVVRRLVMTALRARASASGDLDAAEIVVAELLANTLRHTPGPAWVGLSWDGPHPLLTVTDVGPGFGECPELLDDRNRLHPRLPENQLAERGRGLYLVAQLTRDLVVTPRPSGGSAISVTLDLVRKPESPGGTAPGRGPSPH